MKVSVIGKTDLYKKQYIVEINFAEVKFSLTTLVEKRIICSVFIKKENTFIKHRKAQYKEYSDELYRTKEAMADWGEQIDEMVAALPKNMMGFWSTTGQTRK